MSNSELLDRTPPHSAEAELKCLGAVVRKHAEAFDRLRLTPEDFYLGTSRALWTAFTELREARTPLDDASAIHRSLVKQLVNEVDAIQALQTAAGDAGFTVHPEYYGGIVKQFAQRRMIQRALTDLHRSSWDDSQTVEEILATCEQALGDVKTGRYDTDPVPMEAAILAALDLAERAITRGEHLGVPSGFLTFDQEVGGFFPAELSILAARTGIGKSSLAMQYAVNVAKSGRRVYVAVLEMRYVEVALKLLCSAASVKVKSIRTGRAQQEELQRMVEQACTLSSLPICLHDWPQLRAYDIRRAARRFRADLVIVDYLTLLTPTDKKDRRRYEQVGQIVKDLKATARELDVPVLALAQINREAEKQGKDTHPRLHQLRETGDIEQDADSVILLHRLRGKKLTAAKSKEEDRDEWDAEIEVAKARLGSETTIKLDWHPECEQYSEHGMAVPGRADTAPNYEPMFKGDHNGF